MRIRIIQTGTREFRDVYDLGFELNTPVKTELGEIVEDEAEVELVRTKKKVLEAV